MIEKGIRQISYDDFYNISNNNNYLDLNNLITRHLIHQYIDGYYEFTHLSLFEFFLAKKLTHEDYFKRKLYLEDDFYVGIKEFYISELMANHTEDIRRIKNSITTYNCNGVGHDTLNNHEEFVNLLKCNSIRVEENPEIEIMTLIKIFPLVKKVTFMQYRIGQKSITNYFNDDCLNLSLQYISSLEGIGLLGKFKSLELNDNQIATLDQLNIQKLDRLDIKGNPLTSFEALKNIKINILRITLNNEKEIEEVFSMSNIQEFLVDVNSNIEEVYLGLYKKFTDGYKVKVSSMVDVKVINQITQKYQHNELLHLIDILNAIYQLQKHSDKIGESTLTVGHRLGWNLSEQGKYEEEEKILREVYFNKIELLGIKHESTLKAGHRLGENLINQQKYGEAKTILEEVYRLREEILGTEHNDTLATKAFLDEINENSCL